MRHNISEKDLRSIRLSERDSTKSILQNIAILLSTRQQSVPLYRQFGLPMAFLDRPTQVAKPMLYAEVQEAIRLFEPRAELIGITFEEDPASPGTLIPVVEVEVNG